MQETQETHVAEHRQTEVVLPRAGPGAICIFSEGFWLHGTATRKHHLQCPRQDGDNECSNRRTGRAGKTYRMYHPRKVP